jgi:hypothetical protein
MSDSQERERDCCSDCDAPETCLKVGCVGMATERERCGAVAEAWLYEFARTYTCLDGDRISRLADLLLRERAAARDEALRQAASAVCHYCAQDCEIVTTTVGGHELPYSGTWHVNDVDPMVVSQCQASAIRALKAVSK